MILTGILRHYASVLMATQPAPLSAPALRENRALSRGLNLRTNAHNLSAPSFLTRKQYLTSSYQSGAFLKDPENRGKPAANPMTDPAGMDQMMGMLKGNMAMMIPNSLIMGWINTVRNGAPDRSTVRAGPRPGQDVPRRSRESGGDGASFYPRWD